MCLQCGVIPWWSWQHRHDLGADAFIVQFSVLLLTCVVHDLKPQRLKYQQMSSCSEYINVCQSISQHETISACSLAQWVILMIHFLSLHVSQWVPSNTFDWSPTSAVTTEEQLLASERIKGYCIFKFSFSCRFHISNIVFRMFYIFRLTVFTVDKTRFQSVLQYLSGWTPVLTSCPVLIWECQ